MISDRPLARLASDPTKSRGRLYPERSETRGPRDAFQRDRDRIIHSIAFRRLRHKTQVFIAPDGDHYRVRLTHSLEVAQIGRTMARALGLNEDLTEALCLAHDIGHPPFGHAGEDALEACLAPFGGFDHNAHTLRVLTQLESPYPRFDGLNLTWETLEGLAKHNGPITAPTWAMREVDAAFRLDLSTHASAEAQVAAIADDIAYDNHDIDDGIRAGLLDLETLLDQPMIARGYAEVGADYPDVPRSRRLRELIRRQIGAMVSDLLAASVERAATLGVDSVDDVRAAKEAVIGFSGTMARQERDLKRFMYRTLYHHPSQIAAADAAREVVARLFETYANDSSAMGGAWCEHCPEDDTARARHVADYIAGMTDRFAVQALAALHGRAAVPDALAYV